MTQLYLGANAKAQAICFALCFAGRDCRRRFRIVVHKKSGLFRARPSRPFRYGRHWCDFYMLH